MPRGPKKAAHKPPDHFSEVMRAFWSRILDDYELADHHLRVLQAACEAWDRMVQARELLAEAGPVYLDRFGAPRKHPAISIEEAARLQFIRALRELDLEGEPLPDPRPPRRL